MSREEILCLVEDLSDLFPEKRELLTQVRNGAQAQFMPPEYENPRRTALKKFADIQSKARSAKAEYHHYKALIELETYPLKKDLLSHELMTFRDGMWREVKSKLQYLNSIIRDIPGFNVAALKDHLARCSEEYEPKLLIDIDEWDGMDHISEHVKKLQVSHFNSLEVTELIKEFCSLIFERAYSPNMQNKAFILKGAQGCGKDEWFGALFSGFEQYYTPVTISSDIKDFEFSLTDNLLLNISEIDRLLKYGDAFIKDSISKSSSKVRRSYDVAAITRNVRSSIIGSTNNFDIFRDPSGNRRFLFFEIEKIDWSYNRSKKKGGQLVSQMLHLSKEKYRASNTVKSKMDKYLLNFKAEDPEEIVLENYKIRFEKSIFKDKDYIDFTDICLFLDEISKNASLKNKKVLTILRRNGFSRKVNGRTRYLNPAKLNR